MANHKSAKKRSVQSKVKNAVNTQYLTKFRSTLNKFNNSLKNSKLDEAVQSLSDVNSIMAKAVKKGILKKAIKYGGSSINDYVSPDGTLGNFQNNFKVYGREGDKIRGYKIKKEVLYGRSTFFCPELQK